MATRNNRNRPAVDTGERASFEVLSNLSHDNEDYLPGDTVDLTESQAIELGPQVVKPAAKAAKAAE